MVSHACRLLCPAAAAALAQLGVCSARQLSAQQSTAWCCHPAPSAAAPAAATSGFRQREARHDVHGLRRGGGTAGRAGLGHLGSVRIRQDAQLGTLGTGQASEPSRRQNQRSPLPGVTRLQLLQDKRKRHGQTEAGTRTEPPRPSGSRPPAAPGRAACRRRAASWWPCAPGTWWRGTPRGPALAGGQNKPGSAVSALWRTQDHA